MPARNPAERALIARLAVESSWAATPDRSARTAPARAGLDAKFVREVDERWPGLSEADRQRRAEHLRKAHFARLALRSAQARRRKAAGGAAA